MLAIDYGHMINQYQVLGISDSFITVKCITHALLAA